MKKGEEQGRSLFGISLTERPKWQQFLICSSGFFFGYLVNGVCEVCMNWSLILKPNTYFCFLVIVQIIIWVFLLACLWCQKLGKEQCSINPLFLFSPLFIFFNKLTGAKAHHSPKKNVSDVKIGVWVFVLACISLLFLWFFLDKVHFFLPRNMSTIAWNSGKMKFL